MKSFLMCLLVVVLAGCNAEPLKMDIAAFPGAKEAVKTYVIVKSGECYSWKSGSYIAPDCYTTFKDVEYIIDRIKQIRAEHVEAQNKTWEIVNN